MKNILLLLLLSVASVLGADSEKFYGRVLVCNTINKEIYEAAMLKEYAVNRQTHTHWVKIRVSNYNREVQYSTVLVKRPYSVGSNISVKATHLIGVGVYAEGSIGYAPIKSSYSQSLENPATLVSGIRAGSGIVRGLVTSVDNPEPYIGVIRKLGYELDPITFGTVVRVRLDDINIDAYVLTNGIRQGMQPGKRITFTGLQSLGALVVQGVGYPVYAHYQTKPRFDDFPIKQKHIAPKGVGIRQQPGNQPQYQPAVYEVEPHEVASIAELAGEDFWLDRERASITLTLEQFVSMVYGRTEEVLIARGMGLSSVIKTDGIVDGLITSALTIGSGGKMDATIDRGLFGEAKSLSAKLPGTHGVVFGFNNEQASRFLGSAIASKLGGEKVTRELVLGALREITNSKSITITFSDSTYQKLQSEQMGLRGGKYDTYGTRNGEFGRYKGSRGASVQFGACHVYKIVVEDIRFNKK